MTMTETAPDEVNTATIEPEPEWAEPAPEPETEPSHEPGTAPDPEP
jgi:hypothetical protein